MYRYNAKLMKGGVQHAMYACTHYEVTDLGLIFEGQSGIRITLCPSGPVIELPRDGESVYVTTADGGHNVEAYHWPPRKRITAAS